MIGTNDLERAKVFYDSLLGTLGVPPARIDGHRVFYRTSSGIFSVTTPINGEEATCANGMTIGFAAASPAQADAWHAAGLAAGGTTCEGPRAFAKAARVSSISPTFATSTVTSSARCTDSEFRTESCTIVDTPVVTLHAIRRVTDAARNDDYRSTFRLFALRLSKSLRADSHISPALS